MPRRILEVMISAQNVDAALDTYRRNLGLEAIGCVEGEEGHVKVGETSLVLLRPDIARQRLPLAEGSGEGLLGLTLEVEDLQEEVARLRRHGVEVEGPTTEGDLQVAHIPPQFAHGVPIRLVQQP
jgi:catechol 2,3-dioxygenase-like lactoylglutathione lyase family enzyme